MATHIWRGSVALFWVVALIAALDSARNGDSWQLMLVVVMGVMSAVIMAIFKTRRAPIAVPVAVHHE